MSKALEEDAVSAIMRHRRLDNFNTGPGEGFVTGTGSTVCQSSAPAFAPRSAHASWAWSRTHWTDNERAALRATCEASIALERAADHLGRSPSSVAWKAKELGISLPPSWRNLIMPSRATALSGRREMLCYPYINTRRTEHEALLRITSMVPSGLPEWIRADVCQNIMVEVLEGKAKLETMNFATVASFIRRTRRENGDYRTVSLDAPVGDTDLRRIDMIADDPERLWDYEQPEIEFDSLPDVPSGPLKRKCLRLSRRLP